MRVKKFSKRRAEGVCFDQRCAMIDLTQCMESCVSAFISAIVCFMCENLQYESVYFKELHKNQGYYDRQNTEWGQL